MAMDPSGGVCLIRRVVIRNYKSIAACDVELGPLTFLVGPNGSGKSNFLDALAFVSDALRHSLQHAVRKRGGLLGVVRKGPEGADDFAIRVDFELTSGTRGHYAFHLLMHNFAVLVQHEECFVSAAHGAGEADQYYRVSRGIVQKSTLSVQPASVADRLYLVNASGTPEFRPVYDALSRLAVYNPNPAAIRELQAPGSSELLERDCANLPSVLRGLEDNFLALKSRIEQYLTQLVPSIATVGYTRLGSRDTLESRETVMFDQRFGGEKQFTFAASDMSDGTLRALAILVALFQRTADGDSGPLLVGVEEPETALHPAAAGVLIDAMRDAVSMRQVIVASHSPELLDNSSIGDSEILAVLAEDGLSRIGHLDEAGRSILRDHLFTAGELLRMNQLRPEPSARSLKPEDLELFGTGARA